MFPKTPPTFETDNPTISQKYHAALQGLKGNLRKVHGYTKPVLIEGGSYPGIWLECGPLEGLVYGVINPEIAVANHEVFFDLQRDDNYLPCYVWFQQVGASQIQMVVPIAATALEVVEQTGNGELLNKAYLACSRWDEWLVRYRNTRGTGLCEAFCEYDTGHDNSPRWKGLPKECAGGDARVCPQVDHLPYLAPDLSATVYGGRVALSKMAKLLDETADADRWAERAETIRQAILKRLLDAHDECFYDRNSVDEFVRIRGDLLTRVLGEHVVDAPLFEQIYRRHIHNPAEFWTPYPFPSIAANDPSFDHRLPPNSWGGASQALTALRAPRWMEYYGKFADLAHLMEQWVKALAASPGFMQQLNPWTGEFSTSDGYSPAMLVLLDFTSRLCGVREGDGILEWNCRLPEGAKTCSYLLPTRKGNAELIQDAAGAQLRLAGQLLLRTTGVVRITTDLAGVPLSLTGTAAQPVRVNLAWADGQTQQFTVAPDEKVALK